MEVLEYNEKPNTLGVIKRVINTGNIEKMAFCGIGLITCLTNNSIGKITMSVIFIRKLYKLYKNNKIDIDTIFDNVI